MSGREADEPGADRHPLAPEARLLVFERVEQRVESRDDAVNLRPGYAERLQQFERHVVVAGHLGKEARGRKELAHAHLTTEADVEALETSERAGAAASTRERRGGGPGRAAVPAAARRASPGRWAPQRTKYCVPRVCPFTLTFFAAISFCIGKRIVPTSVPLRRCDLLAARAGVALDLREQLIAERFEVGYGFVRGGGSPDLGMFASLSTHGIGESAALLDHPPRRRESARRTRPARSSCVPDEARVGP